jgi:hypothetical protein
MRDQTETLDFFKNAINLAVMEIERRLKELSEAGDRELKILTTLAQKVGLSVPKLSLGAERMASKLTWAPIAERYLVAFMRPLIQTANSDPKHSRAECHALWKAIGLPKLASENGLSHTDAPVVQNAVEWVLFESDLLKQRVILDWNGRTCFVHRRDNQLIVEA